MSEKKNIMSEDSIYVIYTFGISTALLYLGMVLAYHG